MPISRRQFNAALAGSITGGALASILPDAAQAASYRGPNVILVRFGGGVRRAETIEAKTSFAPFLVNVLAKRGVLIPNVTIAELKGVDTSHAEGTLNLLTGRYKSYEKVGARGLAPLLEPSQPTLFEYLRKSFAIPIHQALLVNGEDRPQEEYLTYGGHGHYGIAYRSEVLGSIATSCTRFARILREGGTERTRQARKDYAELHRATIAARRRSNHPRWNASGTFGAPIMAMIPSVSRAVTGC